MARQGFLNGVYVKLVSGPFPFLSSQALELVVPTEKTLVGRQWICSPALISSILIFDPGSQFFFNSSQLFS